MSERWILSPYCTNEHYDWWGLNAKGPMIEPKRRLPAVEIEVMPVSEAIELVREAWDEAIHASGRYEMYGDTDELDAFVEKRLGPNSAENRGNDRS